MKAVDKSPLNVNNRASIIFDPNEVFIQWQIHHKLAQ